MSENDNKPDMVYTVSELCDRWKCDRHSILDAIRAGRLAAFKLGKRSYRISLPEVLRYEKAA